MNTDTLRLNIMILIGIMTLGVSLYFVCRKIIGRNTLVGEFSLFTAIACIPLMVSAGLQLLLMFAVDFY